MMLRQASRLLAGSVRLSRRPFSTATEVPAAATTTNADSGFMESWKKVIPNIDPPKTPSHFMNPRPATPSSIPSKITVNFVLPYASELSAKELGLFGLYAFLLTCFLVECDNESVGKEVVGEAEVWNRQWEVVARSFFRVLRKVVVPTQRKKGEVMVMAQESGGEGEMVAAAKQREGKEVDMVIIPATTGQMGVLPGHVPTIAELKPGILSVHEGNDVTKYFLSSGFAFIHANSVADVIAVEAVPVDHIDPSLVQKGLTDFTQKLSSATTELDKAEAQIGVDIHSALNAALSG
uniref:ATP synthase F1 complex delta/epsilon subunit N-terminal domain-containing protein n=1 Tax=Quercus lobata TaxID=97700 RepID=A0A7N2N1B6_QUELO